MAELLAVLSFPLGQSAADEGRNIIISMLLVGLVFLAVIALGELSQWRHRRKHASRSGRGRAL